MKDESYIEKRISLELDQVLARIVIQTNHAVDVVLTWQTAPSGRHGSFV